MKGGNDWKYCESGITARGKIINQSLKGKEERKKVKYI